MSQVCQITGKKALTGHNVSHANNKTKRRQEVNLRYKRYLIPELKTWVRLRISTHGIKSLTRFGGLAPYLLRTPLAELDPVLRPWKRALASRLQIACH